MQLRGKPYDLVVLKLGKEDPAPSGWVPGTVRSQSSEEKCVVPVGGRTAVTRSSSA